MQKDLALDADGAPLAETWREDAIVRAALGDDDGAMRSAHAALRLAPSPEIFADRLAVLPELLHGLPGWEVVRATQGDAVW